MKIMGCQGAPITADGARLRHKFARSLHLQFSIVFFSIPEPPVAGLSANGPLTDAEIIVRYESAFLTRKCPSSLSYFSPYKHSGI